MTTLTLRQLNSLDDSAFVSALGGIYESSPWVARAVAPLRPFHSLQQLQSAMSAAVSAASDAQQLALIKSHPELALKGPAAHALTAHSQSEQQRSGMASLAPGEQAQFERYSKLYRERHGFPFIIAVLTLDRDAIIRSLGERIFLSTESERRRALAEIDKIAAIRLAKLLPTEDGADILVPPPALGATRSTHGAQIVDCQYGKSRVRVLKVIRDTPQRHSVLEVDAQVLLRGPALDATFSRGDNAYVVPTDTVKNTVLVLARENLTDSLEDFGSRIGSHFLNRYSHLESVDVKLVERVWQRMAASTETSPGVFNGPEQAHEHSFVHRNPEKPHAHVVSTRSGVWVESGVSDLMVLKSTGSGFAAFPRCELTLLPETDDRILSTKVSATWSFASTPARGFRAANAAILKVILDRFATRYSVSVQATLYEMELDALAAVPELGAIKMTLPNVHFLLYNMAPFNLENKNRVFVPTDEPHGTIELKVARGGRVITPHSEKASNAALNELVFPTSEPCAPLPPRPRL